MKEDSDLHYIRELGFRITPQRKVILEALQQHNGHMTATEIYQWASETMPTLNQATVYRVLDFFGRLNLVVRSDMAGQIMYEFVGEQPHHHLVCRECKEVQLLDDHHFAELIEHLAAEHRFQAELHHLAIPGLCQHCQLPQPDHPA